MDDLRREVVSLRRQVRLLSAVALGAFATLLWASGGQELTASVRALVSGGVLFEGAGGATTQDGANFFWDDANNRLGLGTASPSSRLDVNGSTRLRSTTSFGSSGQEAEVAWSSNVGNGEPGTFFRAKSGRSAVLGSNGNIAGVTVNSSGDVTVNEGGIAADFRVESDTNANALFLNGVTGFLGIGTDTPRGHFDLNGTTIMRTFTGPPLPTVLVHDYALPAGTYIKLPVTYNPGFGDSVLLTGMSGGVDGRIVYLHVTGTNPIRFRPDTHPDSAPSLPQNRFSFGSFSPVNVGTIVRLMYDGELQRWRGGP